MQPSESSKRCPDRDTVKLEAEVQQMIDDQNGLCLKFKDDKSLLLSAVLYLDRAEDAALRD